MSRRFKVGKILAVLVPTSAFVLLFVVCPFIPFLRHERALREARRSTKAEQEELACPFKLTLEAASRDQGKLVADFTVENTSNKPIGWDREFSVGVLFRVRVNSFRFERGETDKNREPELLDVTPNEIGYVPTVDGEDARSRFVVLAPREKLKKRIDLTGRYRTLKQVPRFGPQGEHGFAAAEMFERFQIPSSNLIVELCAVYILDDLEFRSCFGFELADVHLWRSMTGSSSNVVRIEYARASAN